nr:MAG TPA: hypothetical protein [Microviridae sp.]
MNRERGSANTSLSSWTTPLYIQRNEVKRVRDRSEYSRSEFV